MKRPDKKPFTVRTGHDGFKIRYHPDSGYQIIEGRKVPSRFLQGGISKKINDCARRRGLIRSVKETIDPTRDIIRILELGDRISHFGSEIRIGTRSIALRDRPVY